MRRYLELRAATEPLVLVIEDIHWADAGTLDLIEDLADRGRAKLLLLCLTRPELLDTRPGWGGGKTNAAAIGLEPLSPAETERLVRELLRIDAMPDSLRDQVVTLAGGNPLYVEEFLGMLIDTKQIERRGRRWTAVADIGSLAVPPTVQGLIAARLDRAPERMKRALQCASVIGRVFWTNALTALEEDLQLSTSLREAERRGLVIEEPERGPAGSVSYRFKHVLIRDVAYAAVPKADRLRLHDRFARWLEGSIGAEADYGEIIAHHAEQAFLLARELGSPEAAILGRRAFDRLLAAATAARKRQDLKPRINLYQRASDAAAVIKVTPAERIEVEGFRAMGHYIAGHPGAVQEIATMLDRARREGPSEVLCYLLGRSADVAFDRAIGDGRVLDLLTEAETVANAVGDADLTVGTLLQRSGVLFSLGALDASEASAKAALELARTEGGARQLSWCLARLAQVARQRGQFTDAQQYYADAERQDARPSAAKRLDVTARLMSLALSVGDVETALSVGEAHLALAEKDGTTGQRRYASLIFSDALLEAHRFAAVEPICRRLLDLIGPEAMAWVPECEWRIAAARLALGDLVAAAPMAETAHSHALPTDFHARAFAAKTLADVRAAQGDHSAADHLYAEALEQISRSATTELGNDLRRAVARRYISRGRLAEARELLTTTRASYADPLAFRRLAEIDALLKDCTAVGDGALSGG